MPRNFLLRMGQMMAERQRNMTIVKRTARWYRMERIKGEEQTIPYLEERLDKLNAKINSINIISNTFSIIIILYYVEINTCYIVLHIITLFSK